MSYLISLAIVLSVALSGCFGPSEPSAPPAASDTGVEVVDVSFDTIPAVGAQGQLTTVDRIQGASRPANLTGALFEARPTDGPSAEPALVHRFRLVRGDEVVGETAEPNAQGLYRIELTPEAWPSGRLDILYSADGSRATPTASAGTHIEAYLTLFVGLPFDSSTTQFQG